MTKIPQLSGAAFGLGFMLLGYEILSLSAVSALQPKFFVAIVPLILGGMAIGMLASHMLDARLGTGREFLTYLQIVLFLLLFLHFKVFELFASHRIHFLVIATASSTAVSFVMGLLQAEVFKRGSVLWLNGILCGGGVLGAAAVLFFQSSSYQTGVKYLLVCSGLFLILDFSARYGVRSVQAFLSVFAFLVVALTPFYSLDGEKAQPAKAIFSNAIAHLKILPNDRQPGSVARYPVRFEGKSISYIYDAENLDQLEDLKSESFFHLLNSLDKGAIAIVGAGGGSEILQARMAGFKRVVAVEINELMVRAARTLSRNPTLHYDAENVLLFIMDGRRYFSSGQSATEFDTIVLPSVKRRPSSALEPRPPTYLFTVEAFEQYLKHLSPRGTLIIRNGFNADRTFYQNIERTLAEAVIRAGISPNDSIYTFHVNATGTKNLRNTEQSITLFSRSREVSERAATSINPKSASIRIRAAAELAALTEEVMTDDYPMNFWTQKNRRWTTWILAGAFALLLAGAALAMPGLGRDRSPLTLSLLSGILFSHMQGLVLLRTSFASGMPMHAMAATLLTFLLAGATANLVAQFPSIGRHRQIHCTLMIIAGAILLTGLGYPYHSIPPAAVVTLSVLFTFPSAFLNSLLFGSLLKHATARGGSIPLLLASNCIGCLCGGASITALFAFNGYKVSATVTLLLAVGSGILYTGALNSGVNPRFHRFSKLLSRQ